MELVHPTEGRQIYGIPQDGGCCLCIDVQEQGFASIPFNKLCEMIKDSESDIAKYFASARHNKMTGNLHFGDEKVLKLHARINETYIKFHGYTLEDFKLTYKGRDPTTIGLPCTRLLHPVQLAWVEIYWVPQPGPLFKLKMGASEASQWLISCMPDQVFKEQGQFTMEQLAGSMEAQSSWGDILLSHAKFQELMSQTKSAPSFSTAGGQPTSTGRDPVGGSQAWASAVSRGAHQPLAIRLGGVSLARSATVGAALAKAAESGVHSSPSVLKRVESPLAKFQALQGAQQDSGKSLLTAANLMRQSGGEKRSYTPSVASAASQPLAKTARLTTTPTKSSESLASVVQTLTSSRVPMSSTGLKAPATGGGGTKDSLTPQMSADAQLHGIDLAHSCKFQRAARKCHPIFGLLRHNMFEHLKNLKKFHTQAVSSDPDKAPELQFTIELCQDSTEFTWPKLLASAWKQIVERVQRLTGDKSPLDDLTTEAWMLYTGRYSLEFMPPKAKDFDLAKVWSTMDLEQRSVVKPLVPQAPTVWSLRFSTEDRLKYGTQTFSLVVLDGMFIPLIKKGKAGIPVLLEIAEIVATRIDHYQAELRKELADVAQKCNVIFLLHSQESQHRGCSIKDLEAQVAAKKSVFMDELKAQPCHKACIDAAYSLWMNEAEQWPKVLAMKEEYKKTSDIMPFADTLLKNYSRWSTGAIRHQALRNLQEIATKGLCDLMEGFGPTDGMDEGQEERVSTILQLMHRCAAKWQSPALLDSIRKKTDFSAMVMSKSLKANMLQGCQSIAITEPVDQALALSIRKQLPPQDGVVIVFDSSDEIGTVSRAMSKLAGQASESYPHSHSDFVTVGRELIQKSKLSFNEQMEDEKELFSTASRTLNSLYHLRQLSEEQAAYLGAADSAPSRLSADTGLVKTKRLVHSYKQCFTPDAPLRGLPLEDKQEVQALRVQALETIHEHGKHHIEQGRGPLSEAQDRLKPGAGGSTDSKSWKQSLNQDCKLVELLDATGPTLEQLLKDTLIENIKKLHTDRAGPKQRSSITLFNLAVTYKHTRKR